MVECSSWYVCFVLTGKVIWILPTYVNREMAMTQKASTIDASPDIFNFAFSNVFRDNVLLANLHVLVEHVVQDDRHGIVLSIISQ